MEHEDSLLFFVVLSWLITWLSLKNPLDEFDVALPVVGQPSLTSPMVLSLLLFSILKKTSSYYFNLCHLQWHLELHLNGSWWCLPSRRNIYSDKMVVSSGGSWWKWPGGLRNFISGWTYRIVALAVFIINGVSSHSSSPNLIELVIFSCPYWYTENIYFCLMKPNPKA